MLFLESLSHLSLDLAPDNPDSPQNVRQSLIHQQRDHSSGIAAEIKVRDRRVAQIFIYPACFLSLSLTFINRYTFINNKKDAFYLDTYF